LEHIRKCFNYIERPQDPIYQAGKEIDKNCLLAQLARQNTFLGERLASKEPAGQKAVNYCPDKAFARMLEIIKTRDKAKKVAERYEKRSGHNPLQNSLQIA
jgi:hypothetical protein